MATIIFYESNPNIKEQLEPHFADTSHNCEFVEEPLDVDNLNSKAEVISIFAGNKISRDLMEKMPNLKLIACRSTGFDHVDLSAAADLGITVTNVPRYGEVTVAEYTIALLLSLSRRLPEGEAAVKAGHIELENLRGFDLQGKTLGIIGTGRIGQHVAKIARGFDMNIVAYDLYPNPKIADELGFQYVSLDEIAQSDIISLHAPGAPETHHIVNEAFLAHVKPRAVIINTARGELIDTIALEQALSQNRLAGAALDVLEFEPLLSVTDGSGLTPEDQTQWVALESLKKMPQVIITPHNAFNSHEAVGRIQSTTAQNIIDFFNGKTPNKV